MENAIVMKDVVKEFKVLNRHEGLKGSLRDLFSRDYKTVTAVDHISINIKPGEIVTIPSSMGSVSNSNLSLV